MADKKDGMEVALLALRCYDDGRMFQDAKDSNGNNSAHIYTLVFSVPPENGAL